MRYMSIRLSSRWCSLTEGSLHPQSRPRACAQTSSCATLSGRVKQRSVLSTRIYLDLHDFSTFLCLRLGCVKTLLHNRKIEQQESATSDLGCLEIRSCLATKSGHGLHPVPPPAIKVQVCSCGHSHNCSSSQKRFSQPTHVLLKTPLRSAQGPQAHLQRLPCRLR